MNLLKIGATFIVLIFSLASFAQNSEPSALRPYSLKFIDEMTAHHKEGLDLANLALTRVSHSDLRKMAREMRATQQRELTRLQLLRRSLFPTAPKFTYRGVKLADGRMQRLAGREFDLAFLDTMILHHPGAIFLGREAVARSDRSELRALGRRITNNQLKELNKMRLMRDALSVE